MTRARARSWLLGAAFVVVTTALQLMRQPGARTWDTIWAEDGGVYTTDVINHPIGAALFRGYAGYVQLVPRILALPTRIIPPSWFAPYLAATGAVVAALCGLLVVRFSSGWVECEPLRWTLGAMVVLVPVGYPEINANIVNLNWTLLAVAFWAVASRRRGRADLALRVALVVLTALTTSLAAVLVPWAILVAVIRRTRDDAAVLVTLVVALGVQGLIDRSTASPARGPWSGSRAVEIFEVRVLGSLVTGERWLGHLWLQHPRKLVIGSIAFVVMVIVLSRPWRQSHDRQWFAASAVALAIVTFVASTAVRGTTLIGLTSAVHTFDNAGSRYGFVPVLLLFSALVVLVDGSRRRWLQALLIAQAVFVITTSLRLLTLRSNGPMWSSTLARATATCRARPELAVVSIPASPGNFVTVVPCDRLR
jgi:hypothetical protein